MTKRRRKWWQGRSVATGSFRRAILRSPFVVVLAIWACLPCLGWNATGHMVVAAIAYNRLPTQVRLRVDAVLQHHPDCEKWSGEYESRGGTVGKALYAFMRASTWPDDIRRSGSSYDHPAWHYIDYPLTAAPNAHPTRPTPNDDLLYAVDLCKKKLGDQSTPAKEKAAYLSWLLHLIGDEHMPLHCCCLVNDRYKAPNGDRGGNDFWVKDEGKETRLHGFWDGLLGSSHDTADIMALAKQCGPAGGLPSVNPVRWSLEGYKAARQFAYLNLTLRGGAKASNAIELPGCYEDKAVAKAKSRIGLAGVRLAATIIAWLR